jgi:hypothetical protein
MPSYRVNHHHHRQHHHYGQSIIEKANERSVLLPNPNTVGDDDKVSKTIKTVRNVIVTIVGTSILLYIIFAIHTYVYEWLKTIFQRIPNDGHAAFEPAFGQDRDEYGKRGRSEMACRAIYDVFSSLFYSLISIPSCYLPKSTSRMYLICRIPMVLQKKSMYSTMGRSL